MVFNELGKFEKMEDPPERDPKDIERKRNKKGKVRAKKAGASTVSLKTVRRSSLIVTWIIWITFLMGIFLIGYKILGAYTS